jgi:hypothetical protein
MTQGQQTPGDYGYDLAHEELGGDVAPDVRPGPEHVGTPPTGGPVEHDEDFGYDEAHDF